jgi:predicted peptidase
MRIIKQGDYSEVFPYIAYVPENAGPKPALLIQLHGAGERGNGGEDLEKVLVHGFCNCATDDTLKDCILVMPQCPTDTFWVAKIESIKKFIDEIVSKYSIDTSRIYLCGLSMGGYGTWFTAMAYPDLFAAISPCCGGGMAWNAHTLKMPIWAFHGLEDKTVSPIQTIEMLEKLKVTNPHLKYNLYEGVAHNSWEKAFTEKTLSWLLSQKKN